MPVEVERGEPGQKGKRANEAGEPNGAQRERRREGIISPMQIAFGLEPVGYTLGLVVKVTPAVRADPCGYIAHLQRPRNRTKFR